jgi:hypothetical protein
MRERERGIKTEGAAIECGNLKTAVLMNRVECKKKEITEYQ